MVRRLSIYKHAALYSAKTRSPDSFAGARVKPGEDFFRPRRETSLVVFVASLAREFGEGRVSVNCRCNRAKTNAGFHRQHELVQKIAGMRRDDSGPENFVRTFGR